MVWMPDAAPPVARFEQLQVTEFHASQLAGRAVGKEERKKVKEKAKASTDWGVTLSQQAYVDARCEAVEVVSEVGAHIHTSERFPVDLSKWRSFQVSPHALLLFVFLRYLAELFVCVVCVYVCLYVCG